jgi:hypothetical protein
VAILSQPPGLWLPLEQLLTLPVDSDARAQLWQLAVDQIDGPEGTPLHVALARHCGQAAAEASSEGQWAVADDQLREAVQHYAAIASERPEQREPVQQELAGLLARLMADLHTSVHAAEPPPPLERGELCWRGYGLALRHRALVREREPWLEALEEQLVREGGITLRQLVSDPDQSLAPNERQRYRRQALDLLLHLGSLHEPCPEWIGLAARELLVMELEPLQAGEPEALGAGSLDLLIGWLTRLPLAPEAATGLALALERVRSSQELLERGLGPEPSSQRAGPPRQAVGTQPLQGPDPQGAQAPSPAPSPSAAPSPSPAPSQRPDPDPAPRLRFSQAGELARHLQLETAAWMREHVGGPTPVRLRLCLDPQAAPVAQGPDHLVLNLAPLLEFAGVEQLDRLLGAFFGPLQGETGARFRLEEPNGAMYAALKPIWQRGDSLAPERFPALIYATELWTRCGGAGGLGAALDPWQLPVAELGQGSSLLRPGNVELAALQSVLQHSDELEEALVEIRRHHHDRQWMERRSERWWMDPSDGLENLCRLHTNAGFYVSSHAPLESLQRWSQASIAALLAGPVLFGNDSIVRMFLPVAQALQRQSGRVPELVQWPGPQAFYNFIADQEVLFVTPLAAEVEAQHRSGRAFGLFTDTRIRPYGLRCTPAPMSIYPNRPDRGFEDSLDRSLEQIERAYRQRPFTVFTAAAGAYGLPLCQAVQRRYGVACLYIGNAMHAYFGVEQNTTADWMVGQRRPENWVRATGLNGIPGVERIEGGRYLG